jgi:hypothetical protein
MEAGPDGQEEVLFRPLEETQPELAARLKHRFVDKWLVLAAIPEARRPEALQMLELKVAPDDEGRRLRISSQFSGNTRWLYQWDGQEASAVDFVEEVAEYDAGWVRDERWTYGATEWD